MNRKPVAFPIANSMNVLACDRHASGARHVAACDELEERCLPGSVRPEDADAIAAHILSQRERRAYAAARDKVAAFLRFWTRKEALAKAIGAGFSIAPEKLEPARAPGWHVRSFCPLPGFIAAIACHTDR